jgi:ATP-dependent DNA helicase DinG
MAELHDALLSLIMYLQKLLEALPEEVLDSPHGYETRLIRERLEGYGSLCGSFAQYDEILDKVFWVERVSPPSGDPFARFVITPLDLGGLMREAVFEPYGTVVCTSATLTVKNDFSFWLRRVGLSGFEMREFRTYSFPSPFPYREHVLLGVPTDAPEPAQEGSYLDFVARYVYEVLDISEGRGLVLFTSYAMLKIVYEHVGSRLRQRGITVLKQGDDDRARLLGAFNTDIASVLFATDSFWEGVDAPGETLKVVIICRLPFRVPSDPVVRARMDAIDASGGNSFGTYALPTAVMRLRQGFGRLMRRSSDHGAVLILDSRIVKKSYGTLFLDSLPETKRSLTESGRLLADVERFLYG